MGIGYSLLLAGFEYWSKEDLAWQATLIPRAPSPLPPPPFF